MSIINRLSDLGSSIGNSLKDRVGAAFSGDDDEAGDDGSADNGISAAPVVVVTDDSARAALGVGVDATLDEVRAAAAERAKGAHAGAVGGDVGALDELDRIATAAEFLEERLLPLSEVPAGTGGAPSPGSSRVRATSRR